MSHSDSSNAPRPRVDRDGFRAGFPLYRLEAFDDQIVGVIPVNRFEIEPALLPGALERCLQPVFGVNDIGGVLSPPADHAQRVSRIGADFHNATITHAHLDPASRRTDPAETLFPNGTRMVIAARPGQTVPFFGVPFYNNT